MNSLRDKNIILGVTGSIAAYKAAELVRLLKNAGAQVRVVLTQGGAAFINELTFQALSGQPVHTHLLDANSEAAMDHISLAKWADFVLIAPASAHCMARLAHGFADDLLTTLCLATTAPIALAPAMNQAMWHHPLTQKNCALLAEANMTLWGPDSGSQACGDQGLGRLLAPETIIEYLQAVFATVQIPCLTGKKVVITAGPTQEAVDPIRYFSNRSSGKMGYALAQAAQQAGAQVTLISGPVKLSPLPQVTTVSVTTAQDMLHACQTTVATGCDVFIATAAVADYRPTQTADHKIKKANKPWTLTLEATPDILAEISAGIPRPFCVGFAAETQALETYAQEKLQRKKLDCIVANDVSRKDIGFDSDENAVTIYTLQGKTIALAQAKKSIIAAQLIQWIAEQIRNPT